LIIPSANEKDLSEIPPKVRQQIHFTFVDTMDEVINAALLDEPESKDHLYDEPLPLHLDELPTAMNEHQLRVSSMTDSDRENIVHSYNDSQSLSTSPDQRSQHPYSSVFAEKDDQI
jgi:ATP-dependent Lon protease